LKCLWRSRSRRIRSDEEQKEEDEHKGEEKRRRKKRYVVFFLVGDSLASEFYVPMFCQFLLHRQCKQSVLKCWHINSDAGESPKQKNTTFRTW
jgi:hypothetical protein